jgi:hypothetical protein
MFDIYRVDQSRCKALEPLGTKSKFWYFEGKRQMLFKAEDRDTGEDWAEKIACELCQLLNLPHVHYILADLYDAGVRVKRGVTCETCAPPPSSLILGNQCLMALDPNYPSKRDRYKVREHTVNAVVEFLEKIERPSDLIRMLSNLPPSRETALDVFVGYIMLDAWIANQDRHHENWGVLLGVNDRLFLAPTYDHGAALARNLSDTEREERLKTNDRNRSIDHFALRAKSAFFRHATDTQVLKTFEAFGEFARHAPHAAQKWLHQLATIDFKSIKAILDEVPPDRMTGIAKEFTLQLLMVNQRHLLKEFLIS